MSFIKPKTLIFLHNKKISGFFNDYEITDTTFAKEYFCEKPKIDEIFFNDIIKNNDFDYSKILNDVDKNNIKLIDIIEVDFVKNNLAVTPPLVNLTSWSTIN